MRRFYSKTVSRGCRVGEGGLGAHVVWYLGMTTWRNKMTSVRCRDSTCMYMHMYIHAHGRRPRDTTMSMQQEDNTDLKVVTK